MIGAVILQVVLIALNAVFASAEIAVISMNETKLKKMAEDGNKKAIKLSKLTEQPARFSFHHPGGHYHGRPAGKCFRRGELCRTGG